jgi:hypothetical protein
VVYAAYLLADPGRPGGPHSLLARLVYPGRRLLVALINASSQQPPCCFSAYRQPTRFAQTAAIRPLRFALIGVEVLPKFRRPLRDSPGYQ